MAPSLMDAITNAESLLKEWLEANSPLITELDSLNLSNSAEPPTPSRLGLQFELTIAHWIEHCLKPSRFAKNIPLFDTHEHLADQPQRQLGELDFVFQTSNQKCHHWETTIKFYLCRSKTIEQCLINGYYIGPNERDRLDKKIDRLNNHQLPIARTSAATRTLSSLGFDKAICSGLLSRGRLFYPLLGIERKPWTDLPGPIGAHPNHLRGWWTNDVAQLKQLQHRHWVLLERAEWMSSINLSLTQPKEKKSHEKMDRIISLEDVNKIIPEILSQKQSRHPLCIAAIDPSSGHELERGMIL